VRACAVLAGDADTPAMVDETPMDEQVAG
jgi:hypothetical protein